MLQFLHNIFKAPESVTLATPKVRTSINALTKLFGEPKWYYDSDFPSADEKSTVAWVIERPDSAGQMHQCEITDFKHWRYFGYPVDRNEVFAFSVYCGRLDLFPEIKV